MNQPVVRQSLQTTPDENVFVMGDCASCPWPARDTSVPLRAQASHFARWLAFQIQGKPVKRWAYRDVGSLMSLRRHSTAGSLMGGLTGGSLMIEGYFARLMYLSRYKMHEYALHGFAKVFLDTLVRLIIRRSEPHVRLH